MAGTRIENKAVKVLKALSLKLKRAGKTLRQWLLESLEFLGRIGPW